MDAVGPAGQQSQHTRGVGGVDGLAQDLAFNADYCVSSEDNVGRSGANGLGFCLGQTPDELLGRFAGKPDFGDVGRVYEVRDAGAQQEFVAARRGRG